MTRAESLQALANSIELLRRKHHECEDDYYNCHLLGGGSRFDVRDRCNCGTDETNSLVDSMLVLLKRDFGTTPQSI